VFFWGGLGNKKNCFTAISRPYFFYNFFLQRIIWCFYCERGKWKMEKKLK
jgi:hypothetical protein